jgi:hypothetical protein
MHGGTSRGPKTKSGKQRCRQAALQHGGYTKEARTFHQEAMHLIRQNKDLLQSFLDDYKNNFFSGPVPSPVQMDSRELTSSKEKLLHQLTSTQTKN